MARTIAYFSSPGGPKPADPTASWAAPFTGGKALVCPFPLARAAKPLAGHPVPSNTAFLGMCFPEPLCLLRHPQMHAGNLCPPSCTLALLGTPNMGFALEPQHLSEQSEHVQSPSWLPLFLLHYFALGNIEFHGPSPATRSPPAHCLAAAFGVPAHLVPLLHITYKSRWAQSCGEPHQQLSSAGMRTRAHPSSLYL